MRKHWLFSILSGRASFSSREGFLSACFWGGLWLRCLIYLFLHPFNNDGAAHLAHVKYVAEHWTMPLADQSFESWHPPLYYYLVALLHHFTADLKILQLFSLFCSALTLLLGMLVIRNSKLFQSVYGGKAAALLIAIQPQFVMFSLYLSNDTLAFLLGAATIWLLCRFWQHQRDSDLFWLYGVLAAGLLTKAQFLVFFIIVGVAVLGRTTGFSLPCLKKLGVKFLLLNIVCLMLGSAKYIQNVMYFGSPFISNQSPELPFLESTDTYEGWTSIVDINISKLVAEPTVSESTIHSIPLLLYGTYWYQYIPESSFKGNTVAPTRWIGSLIYIAAIPVTLALMYSVTHLAWAGLTAFCSGQFWGRNIGLRTFVAKLFIGNLALLLYVFAQYDIWHTLQSRSLYPAFIGLVLLVDHAFRSVQNHRVVQKRLWQNVQILSALFLLYYFSEVMGWFWRT